MFYPTTVLVITSPCNGETAACFVLLQFLVSYGKVKLSFFHSNFGCEIREDKYNE